MIARFTQEDVYRGDGLNLYVYVVNNPLLWFDPSGYKKCSKVEEAKTPKNTIKAGKPGSPIPFPFPSFFLVFLSVCLLFFFFILGDRNKIKFH